MTEQTSINNIVNTIRNWFQMYCVQTHKNWGNGFIGGGCGPTLKLNAAKEEMNRYLAQGHTVSLHKVRREKGVTTVIYPAIIEMKP